MTNAVYPLILEPRFDPKIWGGRRLEDVLGKQLPADELYGESLESDDASRIANGPLRGSTLREVLDRHPARLLGSRGVQASRPWGDFPLLAKFIDARQVLSVQVHPNDAEAEPLRKRGKTEAWHIIDAEPGATLITGVKSGVSVDDIATAIRDVRLGDLLIEQPVDAGDTLIVPAGTTHAIGAGVLLYEIQQASDVTYRMYDWGRTDDAGNPRELHVGESLEVVKTHLAARQVPPLEISRGRQVLAACRFFALEQWDLSGDMTLATSGESFRLLSCLRGPIALLSADLRVEIQTGQTVLVPASIDEMQLQGEGRLLVSYVPDLENDVRRPLLDAGHSGADIARLSGDLLDLQE